MTDVVKLIQYRITPLDSEKDNVNILRTFHKDDYKSLDAVIELLKRGKKFEKMWEEFGKKYRPFNIHQDSGPPVFFSRNVEISILMNELEQKYFPKEITKDIESSGHFFVDEYWKRSEAVSYTHLTLPTILLV